MSQSGSCLEQYEILTLWKIFNGKRWLKFKSLLFLKRFKMPQRNSQNILKTRLEVL